MNESFFDKLPVSPFQLRVFLGSLICTFVMVALQFLGVRVPKIHMVFPHKVSIPAPSVFNSTVKKKLDKKVSNYSLQEGNPLVAQVSADETHDYDQAAAYAVIDFQNGNVIASKNLHERLPIASLTKIMTAITALDLASPTDTFTVSQTASEMIPTRIGVVPGERMTLEELLDAGLMTSANDAIQVIKEGIDQKYHEELFINAMNENAKVLGLSDSHFANPQGFDSADNYSSAADLAVLSQYALAHYPLIDQIVNKDYTQLQANQDHKQFDLYNWNGLLDVYPGAEGVKIGNTAAASYTTVVLANRENKKILVVLLGAPGVLERDLWASELLDLGYEQTLGLTAVAVTPDQLHAKYSTWKYWN